MGKQSIPFQFNEATSRNTKCYWLRVAGITCMISYETVMAANFYDGVRYRAIRRDRSYSKTTGRHLDDTGVRGYEQLPDEEFEDLVAQAIHRNVLGTAPLADLEAEISRRVADRIEQPARLAA